VDILNYSKNSVTLFFSNKVNFNLIKTYKRKVRFFSSLFSFLKPRLEVKKQTKIKKREREVKSLVGSVLLDVVHQEVVALILLTPSSDHNAAAANNASSLGVFVDLAQTGPFPQLFVVINLFGLNKPQKYAIY
jgi:hypothetical protein